MEKPKIESEHVPVQVIDYILDELIREKGGRTDYLDKRKIYFLYLIQSYNIYKNKKALFDEDFLLKQKTIELFNNGFNSVKKNTNSNQSYTEIFNIVFTVYETFWHYDIDMLIPLVRMGIAPSIRRIVSNCYFFNYELLIEKKDIAEDHLNVSIDWGWDYELNRHGGSGKPPTKEEAKENIKKKWEAIRRMKQKKN